MAGTSRITEADILRYFETESIEKTDAVFRIVAYKLRERLKERDGTGGPRPGPQRRTTRGSRAAAAPAANPGPEDRTDP